MSYAFRNTLVLIVLIVIMSGIGVYWVLIRQNGAIKNKDREIAGLQKKLEALPALWQEYKAESERLVEVTAKWDNRYKIVPTMDYSAETNAYLNDILNMGAFVRLDVQYTEGQKSEKYGFNVYGLRGEGTFTNFYNFLWYLENRPRLYKVEQIEMREVDLKDEGDKFSRNGVSFDVQVRSYYSSIASLTKAMAFPAGINLSPKNLNDNPFFPLIRMEIPPNFRGLLEVNKARIQAIIQGTAYIVDETGKIWVMKEGDEVYLGYLTRLDIEKGQVEFTLNKGGISEKVILRIKSNK